MVFDSPSLLIARTLSINHPVELQVVERMKLYLAMSWTFVAALLLGFDGSGIQAASAEPTEMSDNSLQKLKVDEGLMIPYNLIKGRIQGLFSASGVHRQKEIKIIGAGFARTGTTSTKAALELLGYKAFHMRDCMQMGLGDLIVKAAASEYFFDQLVDTLLENGYNATIDFPMQTMALKLFKKFPNAKVLFGVRDTPEQWAVSMHQFMGHLRYAHIAPHRYYLDIFEWTNAVWDHFYHFVLIFPHADDCPHKKWAPWVPCVEAPQFTRNLPEVFREWKQALEKNIPSEQLLEFNVKQGWDPLVRFLGVKAPENVAYPKVNEAESMEVFERMMFIISVLWPVIAIALFVLVCWMGERVMRVIRSLCSRSS